MSYLGKHLSDKTVWVCPWWLCTCHSH